MLRHTAALSMLALSACGSSTTTFTETITSIPTTINGVPVTEETIGDQPGVTVETGSNINGLVTDLSDEEIQAFIESDTQRYDQSVAVDLLSLSNTAWNAIPATGTATYTGSFVASVNRNISASGAMTVTADFADNTLDAEHGTLYGYASDNSFVRYDGKVDFSNGEIGAGVANDVTFDLTGDLSSSVDNIIINGPLEGKFIGSPIKAIWAYSLEMGQLNNKTLDVTLNGATAEGHVVAIEVFPEP